MDGADWFGSISITPASFFVIRRPPYSRRQLHLMVPSCGGIRRKYGGSTTRHGLRKGDLVNSLHVLALSQATPKDKYLLAMQAGNGLDR
ncbi:MAG: hypothetical protein N4J56_006816 [Chroococcidiopsis sp. SAG 2025]|nr:hypothetical protein [Chroococcidiopsis sp. SAG 2025]MDV2997111.1 hypothetical protein [Chroococcidiopsis sp. SAG 2025]